MSGKSVEKVVIHAAGKVDGKTRVWDVAVFNDLKAALPFVALLRLAYQNSNTDMIKALDIHAPASTDGKLPTDVKFSKSVVQYSPQASALDDVDLG